MSKEFVGDDSGHVAGIRTVQVEWNKVDGQWKLKELPGTDKFWPAQLVLLAMGFKGPEQYVSELLGLEHDPRTNYKAQHGQFATSVPKVFACRRLPPRPIARRLGDQRRPRRGPRHRRVPDGFERFARARVNTAWLA